MAPFYTTFALFLLTGSFAEYLPPLKEVLDNAEFREALISLGGCRSHLYVCAYRLAQCVERARGPADPPSENVLKETVQRWGDAQGDELCDRSLAECKQQYFACDATAPDPEKVVEATNKKHVNDRGREPLSKRKREPLTDENGDPVRDLLKHAEVDPAWDFDRQMPYRPQKVKPESDPRLMAWHGREWVRRPVTWTTYLVNCLPILVIWLVVVLLRRSFRSFNIRFPRKTVKFGGY